MPFMVLLSEWSVVQVDVVCLVPYGPSVPCSKCGLDMKCSEICVNFFDTLWSSDMPFCCSTMEPPCVLRVCPFYIALSQEHWGQPCSSQQTVSSSFLCLFSISFSSSSWDQKDFYIARSAMIASLFVLTLFSKSGFIIRGHALPQWTCKIF